MKLLDKLELILCHILKLNDEPRIGPSGENDAVKEKLVRENIDPVEDLICMYSWHDGIGYLDAFLHLYSLSEMLESIRRYEKYPQTGTFEWSRDWIPLMTMNADVDILINIQTKEVMAVDAEADTSTLIALNYDHYLDGLIYLFEQNHFSFNHGFGGLLVNDIEWDKMLQRYCLKSAW